MRFPVHADLAGRIRNQLRSRAAEAEQAYWVASEAFIAARLARAAAIAAQRAARQARDACVQLTFSAVRLRQPCPASTFT